MGIEIIAIIKVVRVTMINNKVENNYSQEEMILALMTGRNSRDQQEGSLVLGRKIQ